eukprot:gene2040-biopygen11251
MVCECRNLLFDLLTMSLSISTKLRHDHRNSIWVLLPHSFVKQLRGGVHHCRQMLTEVSPIQGVCHFTQYLNTGPNSGGDGARSKVTQKYSAPTS